MDMEALYSGFIQQCLQNSAEGGSSDSSDHGRKRSHSTDTASSDDETSSRPITRVQGTPVNQKSENVLYMVWSD